MKRASHVFPTPADWPLLDGLIETLKERGVPAEQIVFLKDGAGAIDEIRMKFPEMLKKTRKGDFLIFYFCGHGARDIVDDASRYYFINYDAYDPRRGDKSFLYIAAVYNMIENHFQGSQVLLTADCCSSGGLIATYHQRVRAKGDSNIAYACLASVFAHNGSTGDWTFTKGLIKGFRGHPSVDRDSDGNVTFRELFQSVEEEMAYVELQKAAFTSVNGFDATMKLVPARRRSHERVGRYFDVQWNKETRYRAQVTDFNGEKYRVAYVDGGTEWVGPKRIHEFKNPHFPEGTKVRALSEDGKWYPATVSRAVYNMHMVHYDNDNSPNGVNDEWVPPDGIKPRP